MGVKKGLPVSSSKPVPVLTKTPTPVGGGQQFMPASVMKDIRSRVQANQQKKEKT